MERQVYRAIEDYFWHVEQYYEWQDRYIARDKKEREKQSYMKGIHQNAAKKAYETVTVPTDPGNYKLSPNQNVMFEDDVVYINTDDAEWDELILRGKHEIQEEGATV